MAKVNVAHIVFRNQESQSSILKNENEELRGYDNSQFAGGMVLFNWKDTPETVMFPVDTIKSIICVQEEE